MPRLLATAALAALFAQPALADLTVDDAWANWKAQIRALGLTLDASETREGAALQIGKLTLSGTLPEGAGSFYWSMSGPRFEPARGGAVRVTLPETAHWDLGGALKDEGSGGASVAARCDGLAITMTGTPGQVTSDYSADSCSYSLTSLTVNGVPVDLSQTTGALRLSKTGVRVLTETGEGQLTVTLEAGQDAYDFDYRFALTEDGVQTLGEGSGGARNPVTRVRAVLPQYGIDPLGLHDQLRAGLSVTVDATTDSGGSVQKVSVDGKPVSDQTVEQDASAFRIALDAAGFDEAATLGAFTAKILTPELPFPFTVGGDGVDFRIRIPLLMGEDQDANFRVGLRNITFGDELWALFDPKADLPRDPATLAFDLSSSVSILFEVLDIRAILAGAKPPGMPVMAKTARLSGLTVAAAGAELTGQGDVTLDYTDVTTFDGMPAPEGRAAFTLTGAQALLDRLVAAGLVQEDQATGARMMLAMFSRAAGEDAVTSEIEVRKTGEVLVNGQRVK